MMHETTGHEWTMAAVEAYLVEAAWTLMRLPDREAGWLNVGSSWVEYGREKGIDYAEESIEEAARTLGRRQQPSRAEIGRMTDVMAWLTYIESPMDRKLVLCAAMSRHGHPREWTDHYARTKMNWDEVRTLIRALTSSTYRGHTRTLARNYRAALRDIQGHLIAGERSNTGVPIEPVWAV